MNQSTPLFLAALLLPMAAISAQPSECKQQTVEGSVIEMCLLRGAAFQHDLYTMKADKTLFFSLVDDYSEKVELEHAIPPGPGVEFPLSRLGAPLVKITGGCVPQSKDGVEVARLCNFYWGKFQVVKDVRSEFN